MTRASTANLKNHLSMCLASAQRGHRIMVYSRDRPVAMLVPFDDAVGAGREPTLAAALERVGGMERGDASAPGILRAGWTRFGLLRTAWVSRSAPAADPTCTNPR
ncbi:MAG: hypothetical protein EXR79_05520 [Myxococcales bacterium]|nr:hypothetical protein [Myxococcales bacterium]